MNYSKRKLTNAEVWNIRAHRDDIDNVAGTVHLQISSVNGENNGPSATIDLTVPFDLNQTIREAERALISGARELLKRLVDLSENEIEEYLTRKLDQIS